MNAPLPLRFHVFGAGDPLSALPDLRQARYLRFYLGDLNASSVVEEQRYFDRDYLSEFAAFYALSSRGYPNTCRRLHFFSVPVDGAMISRAAGGNMRVRQALQAAYLGFAVIRPLVGAPLGRTVLKWYPERTDGRPHRVTTPMRTYTSHLAGISLTVEGLAWEQQDAAVGACATVALWSVLHSSALDEFHSVPTTADITRFANRTASLGARVFPTTGLTISQIREAIKEAGLEPIFLQGDIYKDGEWCFSPARFAISCAALVRSGYPGLLFASTGSTDLHAVCVVGFRPAATAAGPNEDGVVLADSNLQYVYLHDDNLGPNVRFELVLPTDPAGAVELAPSAPLSNVPRAGNPADPCVSYSNLRPAYLVAAVPSDLRISPDALNRRADAIASEAGYLLDELDLDDVPDVLTSTRFFTLTDYMGAELGQVLSGRPAVLAKARMGLTEQVVPMSRLLGVVRIGTAGGRLADVLFDTTEGEAHLSAFCTVVFSAPFLKLVRQAGDTVWGYGTLVNATNVR